MVNGKTTVIDGYDVVIAGAGPTGCVLAKELVKKGKKVILLEAGDDSRAFIGTPLGLICGKHAITNLPKSMFITTEEGDQVIVGRGLGGGTKLYAGAAFMPDFNMWRSWKIDLEPYIDEAVKESWVSEIPDDFVGQGARRMMEASAKVGLPFKKMLRHVRWDRCIKGCNKAGVGCAQEAKWEGKYTLEDAIKMGARVMYNTTAQEVILENGKAVGFRAVQKGNPVEVRASAVISSCGGYSSVALAKKAGLDRAGSTFTGDPSCMTFGFLPKGQTGNGNEHQFAAAYHDKPHGCIFGSVCGSSSLFSWIVMRAMKEGLGVIKDAGKYNQVMTVFSKVHDDDRGWVDADGKMSKTYSALDMERQAYSWDMNDKILIASGCDPDNLIKMPVILGHPSGTVQIGKLLGHHCESLDIPNLYFCDASCFPEALGMPPVLTLVALAMYEADYLASVI